LVGLLIQIILFGFFIVVALVFHVRLRATPTHLSQDAALPWKRFLYILYIASAFILIRSIVRVAEFVEGFEGTIVRHEVYLYVFDGVPMAVVMVLFSIRYPSDFSKQARKAMAGSESAGSNLELSDVEPPGK
jgi:hypothetical protein